MPPSSPRKGGVIRLIEELSLASSGKPGERVKRVLDALAAAGEADVPARLQAADPQPGSGRRGRRRAGVAAALEHFPELAPLAGTMPQEYLWSTRVTSIGPDPERVDAMVHREQRGWMPVEAPRPLEAPFLLADRLWHRDVAQAMKERLERYGATVELARYPDGRPLRCLANTDSDWETSRPAAADVWLTPRQVQAFADALPELALGEVRFLWEPVGALALAPDARRWTSPRKADGSGVPGPEISLVFDGDEASLTRMTVTLHREVPPPDAASLPELPEATRRLLKALGKRRSARQRVLATRDELAALVDAREARRAAWETEHGPPPPLAARAPIKPWGGRELGPSECTEALRPVAERLGYAHAQYGEYFEYFVKRSRANHELGLQMDWKSDDSLYAWAYVRGPLFALALRLPVCSESYDPIVRSTQLKTAIQNVANALETFETHWVPMFDAVYEPTPAWWVPNELLHESPVDDKLRVYGPESFRSAPEGVHAQRSAAEAADAGRAAETPPPAPVPARTRAPGKGERVVVVKGRHEGAAGTVFWSGPSKYDKDAVRLGVETDGGDKLWLDAEHVAPEAGATGAAERARDEVFEGRVGGWTGPARPASDKELFGLLQQAKDDYGCGEDDDEWGNNLLSRAAVQGASGRIGVGDEVDEAPEPEEAEYASRLAEEAAEAAEGLDVWGSESLEPWEAYFVAATPSRRAGDLSLDTVAGLFGSALFPAATIRVAPLAEGTPWWESLREYYDGDTRELKPWRRLVKWFTKNRAFEETAFVAIGPDYDSASMRGGSVRLRLMVGRTASGTVAGVVGLMVET